MLLVPGQRGPDLSDRKPDRLWSATAFIEPWDLIPADHPGVARDDPELDPHAESACDKEILTG